MALARIHSTEEWAQRFGGAHSTVTIGNFDGVHLGHQKILRDVLAKARSTHGVASVLTFFPHPVSVLRPSEAPALLQTLDLRLDSFQAVGIDAALVVRFDPALAAMSAEGFIEHFLVNTMHANAVLVGENFRFGNKQTGDVRLLRTLGHRWDFETIIVNPVAIDATVISSSAIRQAIREGHVEDAARMLGRPYSLAGEIRTGTGMGRKLVVPTLNLHTEQQLLPKNGVYATEVGVAGKFYEAVTNVGVRPTFDGTRV